MYFDEEYANGKIFELAGMKIDTVKLYSEQIKNPEITITQMSFEDGDERLDFGPSVLYYFPDRRSERKRRELYHL